MMTGGLSFHSSVACFKCSACGKHLASEKCMLVGKNLYCLVDYQKVSCLPRFSLSEPLACL
eukprot:m.96550 g.96550  ORF g.96550 m.96550 type:complete len:61 (+) comp51327_c0_seq17:1197-1379(+)